MKASETFDFSYPITEIAREEKTHKIAMFFRDARYNFFRGMPAVITIGAILYFFNLEWYNSATWVTGMLLLMGLATFIRIPAVNEPMEVQLKQFKKRVMTGIGIGLWYGLSVFFMPESTGCNVLLVFAFTIFIATTFVSISFAILPIYFIWFTVVAWAPFVLFMLINGKLFMLAEDTFTLANAIIHTVFLAEIVVGFQAIKLSKLLNQSVANQLFLEKQLREQ